MPTFRTIVFLMCLHLVWGEWIDPHSMESNSKSKLPSTDHQVPEINSKFYTKACESNLYLKRIVRLMLNNAYLDKEEEMGYFTGHLNLKLSFKEYEFLLNFSQNGDNKNEVISEVNSIFEVALQKTTVDRYKEMISSFQEDLYYLIFNPTSGALAATCLVLYITYKLLRAKFTWRLILKYFFFLLYITDFVITYLDILQKIEIENMVNIKKLGTTPPECDPQKMSWWTYMKTQFESTFSENPCKMYYHATYSNYKLLVAPTKVLTTQFRTIIVGPVGDIGEAFGKFGRGMFTSLPWGLNVVLFPVMIITSIAIIFMIFLFITKPHFRLSLFHLFTIELGQPARNDPVLRINERRAVRSRTSQNAIQNGSNNRREVVYAETRQFVEDVSYDNTSSHDTEENDIHKGGNEDDDGWEFETSNNDADTITLNSTANTSSPHEVIDSK